MGIIKYQIWQYLKGFGKVKFDGYCKYIEVSKFESCYIK